MRGKRTHALLYICIILSGIITICLTGCGIYAIDTALLAPYNLSNTTDSLMFYGDDEPLLLGYNLWYKEDTGDFYVRCYYYGELKTPTIDRQAGATVQYTVDLHFLYPQDDGRSFYEIYDQDSRKFYFAVSAYGTGIEESGKAAFPLWPN